MLKNGKSVSKDKSVQIIFFCNLKKILMCFGNILTQLEKIYLSENNLTIIRNQSFSRAKYLKTLNISQNKISTLENTAFHSLDRLELINNNKLTVVA
jgi:Leucine-rich repeat (LRR) protein